MKVVILCGGFGTRLREETEIRPKPMVDIGGRPILWHIMKTYAHYGFNDFVLCLGYKGEMIKDYFLNYDYMGNDLIVSLKTGTIDIPSRQNSVDWNITLADTGQSTMTGARVSRIAKYVDTDEFMLTYGDGVTDLDIRTLLEFHRSHGKIGTVTGVSPVSRYGELAIKKNRVISFNEKPQEQSIYISGGYFVFNREFFDFLSEEEDCVLERKPLERLSEEGQLMVYTHKSFWQCMDTPRDLELLRSLWGNGAPWKVWRE